MGLLERFELNENALCDVLANMSGGAIDYADLYFQSSKYESLILEDGIIKDAHYNQETGVGVRAISGAKAGLAYSNDLMLPAIKEAANSAASIVKFTPGGKISISTSKPHAIIYPAIDALSSLSDAKKIEILHKSDEEARKMDPRIKQVSVSLAAQHEDIVIINNQGQLFRDTRPLVRMYVSVIAEENGRRESGVSGGGRRSGYTYFTNNDHYLYFVRDAVRQALLNLSAKPAPAGAMPVVLGPGWPGVLLHEAVGHGLEGDFNRKGTSVFTNRLGERVGTDECTVVDDGTVENRRGSLNIDDEGTPTQRTVLIENGILKNYMQDTLNGRLMNMPSTGNARRESYSHLPLPRMTNTYMLAGSREPEEIIASVKNGIYAVNFGGGQVDITSGNFVFTVSEGYLIENGKITSPVKGATLTGTGLEVLKRVSLVGNDLKLDEGIGVCGKEGQSIPVGVGQPTLKVDELIVGGTG